MPHAHHPRHRLYMEPKGEATPQLSSPALAGPCSSSRPRPTCCRQRGQAGAQSSLTRCQLRALYPRDVADSGIVYGIAGTTTTQPTGSSSGPLHSPRPTSASAAAAAAYAASRLSRVTAAAARRLAVRLPHVHVCGGARGSLAARPPRARGGRQLRVRGAAAGRRLPHPLVAQTALRRSLVQRPGGSAPPPPTPETLHHRQQYTYGSLSSETARLWRRITPSERLQEAVGCGACD